MSEVLEEKEKTEVKPVTLEEKLADIDATEQQLLQAFSMQDTTPPEDYIAYAGKPKPQDEACAVQDDVIAALKTVCDPEIMVNVYDMGLIYAINIQPSGDVFIDMTLTAPGCPAAGILPQQAADAVAQLKGVGNVEVKIVWEPAWTMERMSDEARAMFDLF